VSPADRSIFKRTLQRPAMEGVSTAIRPPPIYCTEIEAELLAIDGYYRPLKTSTPRFARPDAQDWLPGENMKITR